MWTNVRAKSTAVLYLLRGSMRVQIRSDCSWNQTGGSTSFASDSSSTPASVAHSYSTYNVYSAVNQRDSTGISGATNANSFNGFIQNGQRHPLCGGEYLNNCDLGPYGVGDVGDGSCQQHLNTEGCHYDGGKLLNVVFI